MSTRVTATFLDGVLKPDEMLQLPDRTRVNLTIEPVPDRSTAVAAWQALKDRIRQRPIHSGGRRFTRDELHERG